jgi:predicted AlkP superfamily pyrophosphatase or phosphodiesterase
MTGASQCVLLVIDGLGWEQLQQRRHLMPVLAAMAGGAVSTVAPSTTASALTSITTGLPPGEHGIVGYRMRVGGEVLNSLRWTIAGSDARRRVPPESTQPAAPFCGARPPVVTRAEFAATGFTAAHLAGGLFRGWRMPSSLVAEVNMAVRDGAPFVYAYYDGIDKVAHEFGLGSHYECELSLVDSMVELLVRTLPSGTALLVTADHGQVDVGDSVIAPAPAVLDHVVAQSGEGRFRWLHARPGRAGALLDAAVDSHSDVAWVVGIEQVRDEGWLGPRLTATAASRLGEVALVPFQAVAFTDPDDSGPTPLRSRHGSLTDAEMLVPLLAVRAG